ncbi:MAG: hypothetical protein P4L84_17365 [Isosphaeraceae bacterium]|nr:hypothetical protein [Isosphaeraceae bacterium]
MAKPPRKSNWTKQTLRLKDDHGWKCKPGYRIFVADQGAVRFDFPEDWIVRPSDDGTIHIHDREPPDDDVRLSLTVIYLRDDIDWSGLKLPTVLKDITAKGERESYDYGPVNEVKHPRHDLAWSETNYPDPENGRLVTSRTALARYSNIQVVLTLDFWADMSARFGKVWDEIIRTLLLGDYVEDPTQRVHADPLDDLFA